MLIFLNFSLTTLSYGQVDEKYTIKTIVIDAGHGGRDQGTHGRKATEKDIALAIALKLGTYIEKNIPDVKVIYTRTTDVFIDLDVRADIANKNKADLFISIHLNGNPDSRAFGTETYAMGLHKTNGNLEVAKKENSAILFEDDYNTKYEGFDPSSAESYIIFSFLQNTFLDQSLNYAAFIESEFKDKALRKSRGVKQAGFLVLWKTTMPSVLIEAGFLTNPKEEKYLISNDGQEYIASAIYRAFKSYKIAIEEKSKYATKIDTNLKNINIKQEDNSIEFNKNLDAVTFKIQIASSTNSIPISSDFFKGYKNIEEFKFNEYFKYTIGSTSNFEKIVEYKKTIEKNFPDAFVIAIDENRNLIPLNEALQKTKTINFNSMKLHRETKIGIIAAIIIACFIWGFNFLKSKNILTTNDSFYALYSNIDGMEEGSPVIVNGFKVGFVESVKLHETKRDVVIVKFTLEEDLKLPLKTEAIIYPASLIAGKAIKLNYSDSKEFHANHDTIIGVLEQDLISNLSDELMPVKNKIEKLVVSMDSVLAIFDNKRKDDLKKSLDNLENITNELSNSLEKGKLAKIINNAESISTNLKNNNEQITNILANFSNISDSIQKADIKTTIVNANKTLAEFSEISTKINSGEGTIGMLINNDSLYINLNNLAADLDSLIIDLNENPKRYVHFSLFGKKDKK